MSNARQKERTERVILVSALQAALVPKNIQPEEAEMKCKSN